MLYVNDEIVKKGTPYWDRYNEFKKEVLPKFKNPVIIRTSRPMKFNESGLPEAMPLELIPFDQNLEGPDGGEHWRYCDRPPRKRADGNFAYSPRSKTLKNAWALDIKKDSEQIFFFHELSVFKKDGRIIFEDKKADARKLLEKETSDLDVRWHITSDSSPISVHQTGSEDTIRMIAAAWGVENAHDLRDRSIDEIKIALLDAVKASEKNRAATGRGFKEFMAEVNAQNKVSVMANIQKAIDTGVIVYDKSTFNWRFTDSNTPIATISGRDSSNPKAALNKFLSLNDKSARILELALGDSYGKKEPPMLDTDDDGPTTPITPEQLSTMPWNDLRALAKDVGFQIFGLKRPEIEKGILDNI